MQPAVIGEFKAREQRSSARYRVSLCAGWDKIELNLAAYVSVGLRLIAVGSCSSTDNFHVGIYSYADCEPPGYTFLISLCRITAGGLRRAFPNIAASKKVTVYAFAKALPERSIDLDWFVVTNLPRLLRQ